MRNLQEAIKIAWCTNKMQEIFSFISIWACIFMVINIMFGVFWISILVGAIISIVSFITKYLKYGVLIESKTSKNMNLAKYYSYRAISIILYGKVFMTIATVYLIISLFSLYVNINVEYANLDILTDFFAILINSIALFSFALLYMQYADSKAQSNYDYLKQEEQEEENKKEKQVNADKLTRLQSTL